MNPFSTLLRAAFLLRASRHGSGSDTAQHVRRACAVQAGLRHGASALSLCGPGLWCLVPPPPAPRGASLSWAPGGARPSEPLPLPFLLLLLPHLSAPVPLSALSPDFLSPGDCPQPSGPGQVRCQAPLPCSVRVPPGRWLRLLTGLVRPAGPTQVDT